MGSVFKLVSAAAALEEGISPEYVYDCTGSIEVDGQKFKCFDGIAHGVVTMEEAIAESCNGYFVSLMQQVDPTVFLETARKLGFGQGTEFTSGFCSDAGLVPFRYYHIDRSDARCQKECNGPVLFSNGAYSYSGGGFS